MSTSRCCPTHVVAPHWGCMVGSNRWKFPVKQWSIGTWLQPVVLQPVTATIIKVA